MNSLPDNIKDQIIHYYTVDKLSITSIHNLFKDK